MQRMKGIVRDGWDEKDYRGVEVSERGKNGREKA